MKCRKLKKQYWFEKTYKRENTIFYLNQIYLGQGTYGIAGEFKYFDKSIKELNYSEHKLRLPKL